MLNWSVQLKLRALKVITLFYIKKETSQKKTFRTRKRAYIRYVVTIISNDSSLWMPGKRDLKTIEGVQRKAMSWIFDLSNLNYKDKLMTIDTLPLSVTKNCALLYISRK